MSTNIQMIFSVCEDLRREMVYRQGMGESFEILQEFMPPVD